MFGASFQKYIQLFRFIKQQSTFFGDYLTLAGFFVVVQNKNMYNYSLYAPVATFLPSPSLIM